MIPLSAFLKNVEVIAASDPAYRKGRSGDDGFCDCIGLIIGAIRRAGGKWPGIHGSNWAARNAVSGLSPFRSAANLSVGKIFCRGILLSRAPVLISPADSMNFQASSMTIRSVIRICVSFFNHTCRLFSFRGL